MNSVKIRTLNAYKKMVTINFKKFLTTDGKFYHEESWVIVFIIFT